LGFFLWGNEEIYQIKSVFDSRLNHII